MPTLMFDDFGMPVWTEDPAAPVDAAQTALDVTGVDGGIPLPSPVPLPSPGLPPGDSRADALMVPSVGPGTELSYPEGPAPLAAPGGAHPWAQNLSPDQAGGGLTDFRAADVISAPEPAAPAPAVQSPATPSTSGSSAKAGRVDPVVAATAEVDRSQLDAAELEYRRAEAANAAAADLANRRAAVQEEYAVRQAKADTDFQAARNAAQADADRETAQWMINLEEQAQKEPNPKRWWGNQSGFGKVMWLLSLAFGTKAAATAPGVQNIGLAMITEEMNRDMADQRARLAREMETAKLKGTVLDRRHAQRLETLRDDHSIRAGQLLALEKATMERANAPGSAEDRAAMAAANAWLGQQRLLTAQTRRAESIQAREAQLQRGHAMAMQRERQAFEAVQNTLNRKQAYDLATIAAGSKAASDQAEARGNTFTFPKASGIQMKGGGLLSLNTKGTTNAETQKAVLSVAQAATEEHNNLRIIGDALKDRSFYDRLTKNDMQLQRAIVRLAYATAKGMDPGGRVTDTDYANGLLAGLGVVPDGKGGVIFTMKAALHGEDAAKTISKGIDAAINNVRTTTNQKLNAMVDASAGGGNIVWSPPNTVPEEEAPTTNAQREAQWTGQQAEAVAAPTTVKEYRERAARQAAGEENALPPLSPKDAGTVEAFRAEVSGSGPERIDRLRQGALGKSGSLQAQLAMDVAAEDAVAAAKAVEKDIRTAMQYELVTQHHIPTRNEVRDIIREHGLPKEANNPEYIDATMKALRALPEYEGLKKLEDAAK